MNIQELYQEIGGDYNDTLKRIGNERLISKFIIRFIDDTTTAKMFNAYDNGNLKDVFLYAHTLKGICLNLGLANLYNDHCDLNEIVEICRKYKDNDNQSRRDHVYIKGHLDGYLREYNRTIELIRIYKGESNA